MGLNGWSCSALGRFVSMWVGDVFRRLPQEFFRRSNSLSSLVSMVLRHPEPT
jgi:hypothetical protein